MKQGHGQTGPSSPRQPVPCLACSTPTILTLPVEAACLCYFVPPTIHRSYRSPQATGLLLREQEDQSDLRVQYRQAVDSLGEQLDEPTVLLVRGELQLLLLWPCEPVFGVLSSRVDMHMCVCERRAAMGG